MLQQIENLTSYSNITGELKSIAEKVIASERITVYEGNILYEKGDLGFLGTLANYIREKRHGQYTYFNRNFHIEPSNLCIFNCKFCSYSSSENNNSWELSEGEIYDIVKSYDGMPVTEVHIVGSVHPEMDLHYFARIIKNIKKLRPDIHIKAFTAVEMEYWCRKAKISYEEGLKILMKNGQDFLPGGGAEIFDESIRKEICPDKCSSQQWLDIHETAHKTGMPSNATMLYGHIENYRHRIDHMNRLRELQDKTLKDNKFATGQSSGFQAFIPLKFRNKNNQMSDIKEVSIIEDMKNFAVSRIFLDNFDHIKAYWPMIGRETAQFSLAYGVDDIDGTIDDSTRIYSLAGAEEQKPGMTTEEIIKLIKDAGRYPVERDTFYNVIRDFSN